jgi:MFS family permease
VIITTGQIKTIWHAQYPECWDSDNEQHCPNKIQCCDLFVNTPSVNNTCAATFEPPGFCQAGDDTYPDALLCNVRATSSVSYSEFAGIMAGMLTFGIVCDLIGRKNAGTITSIIMLVGISGMTLFDSNNSTTLFIGFSIFFAIFGLGVGGEYPLTASGAAEYHVDNTEDAILDNDQKHRRRVLLETAKTVRRGETIALVFAMQGIGAVLGSLLLLIMIYISDQTRIDCDKPSSNSSGNNPDALSGIWRGFYLIGLLFVAMLLLYRWLVLEEGTDRAKIQKRKKNRKARLGARSTNRWKILRFYAPRLMGTGGNWFVWDIAFYGLKLFSGPIFAAINPQGDLLVQNGWLLFNNLCALAGYYCAARVVDIPWIGRKKLQMLSFAICAFLFMMTAGIFNSSKPETLMFLFFASSFFGQLGANVTTYVMAAETYPTELRGTCHGISAVMGKSGALLATIIFEAMDTPTIFWTCGATSVIGFFLTFVFSVDLTHVSLAEHDAQFELFLEGRLHVYKGRLNAPMHLSNFEKWTGRHGEYDPKWASKLMNREKSAQLVSSSLPHPKRQKTRSSGSKVRALFAHSSESNDDEISPDH